MEKHKAWPDLLREHRDAAVAASTGDIPSVRHRVQHAWWLLGGIVYLEAKKVHERLSK